MDAAKQAADEKAYEAQFMTYREMMTDCMTSAAAHMTRAAEGLTGARIAAYGTPFEARIASIRDSVERLTGEIERLIDRANDEGGE